MMMSATITNWAVDLAEVGAIYPYVGFEKVMVVLGVVYWLSFHAWQIVHENQRLEKERDELMRGNTLEKQI